LDIEINIIENGHSEKTTLSNIESCFLIAEPIDDKASTHILGHHLNFGIMANITNYSLKTVVELMAQQNISEVQIINMLKDAITAAIHSIPGPTINNPELNSTLAAIKQ